MANRQEFLSQLEDQIGSWIRWARELDEKATANAKKLQGDARSVYERRASLVKDLVGQGRVQIERLAAAGDEAWDGIAAGAEQAWSSLRDVAASLADQPDPAPAKRAARPKARKKAKVVKKTATTKKSVPKAAKKSAGKPKRAKTVKKSKKTPARASAKAKASKAKRPARKKK